MIDRIIHFSIFHRGLIIAFSVLSGVLGWFAFQSLPIDAVPDITNIQVQINSSIQALAPEEIERNVTFPIETAMSGIAGVTEVRSLTRFGISQVTAVFEDDVDIYKARQLVSERLQTVSGGLPKNIHPKLGPISTGLGEIFRYTVEADKKAAGRARESQLMALRDLQEWYIRPRLLTVRGVSEVNTIGGYAREFQIRPDTKAMGRYGLHFSDLIESLERTNQNAGGGFVQQTGEQFLIQAVGVLRSIEDIQNAPVKSLESLRTITIGDVAHVEIGHEFRMGAATVRGQEAVIGSAFMLTGENSRTVSLAVATKLDEIGRGLPNGYHIETLYDRSQLVTATLKTVLHNLVLGAVLVVLVLLVLVGNARAAHYRGHDSALSSRHVLLYAAFWDFREPHESWRFGLRHHRRWSGHRPRQLCAIHPDGEQETGSATFSR